MGRLSDVNNDQDKQKPPSEHEPSVTSEETISEPVATAGRGAGLSAREDGRSNQNSRVPDADMEKTKLSAATPEQAAAANRTNNNDERQNGQLLEDLTLIDAKEAERNANRIYLSTNNNNSNSNNTARRGDSGEYHALASMRQVGLRASDLSLPAPMPMPAEATAAFSGVPGAHSMGRPNDSFINRNVLAFGNQSIVEEDASTIALSVTAQAVSDWDDPSVLREKIRDLENAPVATVIEEKAMTEKDKQGSKCGWNIFIIVVASLLIAVAIVLGVVAATGAFTGEEEDIHSTSHQSEASGTTTTTSEELTDTIIPDNTLQAIKERGFIRCRIIPEVNNPDDISIELCHALSAAIFGGNKENVELVGHIPIKKLFSSLENGTVDISTSWLTTHAGRDVFEEYSASPKSFSIPYFYTGAVAVGPSEFVECVNNRDTITGVCKDLVICLVRSTSTADSFRDHMDGASLYLVPTVDDMFEAIAAGACNVLGGEPQYLHEASARSAGYTGEYVFSSMLTTESQGCTMRENDPVWPDFVSSVIQALFTAELENITMENATLFPETSLFGDEYKKMYQDVISTMGNWRDIYDRSFGKHFERTVVNQVDRNFGEGGLLLSPPLAALTFDLDHPNANLPNPVANGVIDGINERGVLRCGIIPERPGFTIEVDSNGTTTWTGMDIDLCHALSAALFKEKYLVEFVELDDQAAGFMALSENLVDVFSGAIYTLEADIMEPTTQQGFSFSPTYFYSKEGNMLALATNQNATQWSDFVRWAINSLIYAEERGITEADASNMPSIDLFGPAYKLMFRLIIHSVGNYGEMYERHVQDVIPRQGSNLLNDGSTPLINPLPLSQFIGQR